MNALEKSAEYFGGQKKMADVLGVKRANVWNWINRDKKLPFEFALMIQSKTGGVITAYDLRPDVPTNLYQNDASI